MTTTQPTAEEVVTDFLLRDPRPYAIPVLAATIVAVLRSAGFVVERRQEPAHEG